MDSVPDDDLRSRVGRVDPAAFDRFVAELLAAGGWRTTMAADDNDLGVDVIGVRDDADGRHLVRVEPSPDDVVTEAEVRRYGRIAAKSDPVTGILIVTGGEASDAAESLAERCSVEVLDGDDLAEMVAATGADRLLDRFADETGGPPAGRADSGGAGSRDRSTDDDGAPVGEPTDVSDGDSTGPGDPTAGGDATVGGGLEAAAPSATGSTKGAGSGFDAEASELPAAFTEVRRDLDPGPVAGMDAAERTRLVQGLVAHAPSDGVTERLLLKTHENGGLFDRPLADYLQENEQPAHVLKESSRGVRAEDEGTIIEPDGRGRVFHLVTNARVLSVVGRTDGDRALSLPLDGVAAADYESALFDADLELTVDGRTYRLPIHHAGDDAVRNAVEYVRRGPHPWEDSTLSFGSIDDPASFDSL